MVQSAASQHNGNAIRRHGREFMAPCPSPVKITLIQTRVAV
jgi:hypothetical protein